MDSFISQHVISWSKTLLTPTPTPLSKKKKRLSMRLRMYKDFHTTIMSEEEKIGVAALDMIKELESVKTSYPFQG